MECCRKVEVQARSAPGKFWCKACWVGRWVVRRRGCVPLERMRSKTTGRFASAEETKSVHERMSLCEELEGGASRADRFFSSRGASTRIPFRRNTVTHQKQTVQSWENNRSLAIGRARRRGPELRDEGRMIRLGCLWVVGQEFLHCFAWSWRFALATPRRCGPFAATWSSKTRCVEFNWV